MYRQKELREKTFDNLKNAADIKKLCIHSRSAIERRLIIQFVVSILSAEIQKVLEVKGMSEKHDM